MSSATYQLYVKFQPEKKPRFAISLDPDGKDPANVLEVEPGLATIIWQPVSEPHQAWSFKGLIGLLAPTFLNLNVSDHQMVITDNHQDTSDKRYHYTLYIEAEDGLTHHHDPQIRNKPS